MFIGYLRLLPEQLTSGVSDPHNALIASGVSRLYMDIENGSGQQAHLHTAIASLSAGDVLVSPSVDLLAPSVAALLDINRKIDAQGASLRVLQLAGGSPLDTGTVEGRAILGALAIMNVLPQPASAQAPAAPVVSDTSAAPAPVSVVPYQRPIDTYENYVDRFQPTRPRGRPATAYSQATEVNRLRSEGLRAVEIAACLGIGRASVYRILSQGQSTGPAERAQADTSGNEPIPFSRVSVVPR